MSGKMDCYGLTDVGRKRPVNEDQFLIADLNKSMRVHQTSLGLDHQTRLFGASQGKLLAVADGMGGHEAGERASQLVIDSVVTYVLNTLHWFFRLHAENDDDFQDELKEALVHCQEILFRDVEAAPQRRGMGTTLTMAYVIWPRMYVVHVGDSRCYLLRDGHIKQLTRDHTMSELYSDALEGTDIDTSRWDNVLYNVIGSTDDDLHPEVYRCSLKLGDSVLLSSDGLTKHVADQRLVELLSDDDCAEGHCKKLVTEANERGGSDNITVVLAHFDRQTKEDCVEEFEAQHPLPSKLDDTDPYIKAAN